ncbi:MAG: hypothetical protein JSS07_09740 [Proteobacteria bacterium]|nr:hypothetical protein [Pseudomonadota bacterium]
MHKFLRFFKKLIKIIIIFILIALVIPTTASIYVFSNMSACSSLKYTGTENLVIAHDLEDKAKEIKSNIKNYHRPEESTFLTFPEWYIVYSSQEYAKTLENNLPSAFPYFSAIKQFWQSYCYVNALSKHRYPFNVENHIMIMVIGSSLTLEYIIKGLYENTMGRFSEWTSSHQQVAEDKYAYHTAKAYAELIPVRPWYEFSFLNSAKGLWQQTNLYDKHLFRKWERKFILSIEYSFKAFYAWVIEKSSHAAFGVADVTTGVWLQYNNKENSQKSNPSHKVDTNSYIVMMPRYQPFTPAALEAIKDNAKFYDIADNHIIMLSAVVPKDSKIKKGIEIFSLPVLISKDKKRVAIITPVSKLHEVLQELLSTNAEIEHIYDY